MTTYLLAELAILSLFCDSALDNKDNSDLSKDLDSVKEMVESCLNRNVDDLDVVTSLFDLFSKQSSDTLLTDTIDYIRKLTDMITEWLYYDLLNNTITSSKKDCSIYEAVVCAYGMALYDKYYEKSRKGVVEIE